jgi:hypothetical protein
VEVTFLAYVLNVKEHFVMHIIPHTNVDFICLSLLQFVMAGQYRRCYALGCSAMYKQGEGKLLRFPQDPERYVHKLI